MAAHRQLHKDQETEELFRRLFDRLPLGIFVIQDRRFQLFNTWLIEVLSGYSESDIRAMDCLEPVFPEDRDLVREAAVLQLKGKRSSPYEYRRLKKDGTIAWCAEAVMPWQYGGKRATLGYSVDITERKRIEEEYRRSQEHFKGIYHCSKDGISFISLDGVLLDVNNAFCRMVDSPREELLGRKNQDLTPTECQAQEARTIQILLQTASPVEYEKELVRRDGSRVYVLSTAFVVRDSTGRPIGIATINKDLTEQRLKEREAREAEGRYRSLFVNSSDAIFVYDFDGNILEVNQAAARISGYPNGDLVRMKISQLLSSGVRDLTEKSQQDPVVGETRVQRHESALTRKDGSMLAVESVIGQITYGSQSVGIQAIVRDVTEQKRQHDNMQFYISEVTRAQEDERKRIARDLHDEAAQALASLSLDIGRMANIRGQRSNDIVQSLSRIRARVDDVLDDVRRLSHQLRPPVLDHLGLLPSLQLLIDDLKTDGQVHARIEKTSSNRRLPAETELALFRIAQETVRNIVKHSRATEAVIKVVFEPRLVRLTVTDNGKGFEMAAPLADFASKGKLGLLGMQERARLVGGSFAVKSHAGKGTTVEVEVAG